MGKGSMNTEIRKLMAIDNVNYKRAKRLLDKFGSYEDVTDASYNQLVETHYIGEVTARSIFNRGRSRPESLV